MKKLGERVRELRKAKGWSQTHLADEVRRVNPLLTTRQSTIQSIESGGAKKPTIIVELSKALGTNATWLRTGKGAPDPSALGGAEIPVFGYTGARERVEIIEGASVTPIDSILAPSIEDGYSAVIVRGTSMLPTYRDGDVLFFRSTQTTPEQIANKDCVVITDKDRSYVKRVKRGRTSGLFDLLSYNPEIDPIIDVKLKQAWIVEWIRRG